MTKKQLIDSFEQVDEFCIQFQDIDETNDWEKVGELGKVGRYEWICTKDMDQFHACEAGWEIVKVHFDKDGYFEGTVLNRCEKCGKEFESKYSEACNNPEVLDIDENGVPKF